MRCKRCGEPLEPMETRCPVCGKTVAPRRKAPAQRTGETSIKLPQLDKFTHAYSADAARSRMLQLATILVVLASLALLVVVFVGVGDLKNAVKDLELTANAQLQALQNNQNQVPEATEGTDENQTEPQEDPTEDVGNEPEADLPLSQQDVDADLILYRSGSGNYAAASMDLGSYDEKVDAWVNTVREGNSRQTNVAWILSGSGDRVDLKLHDSYGGENQVDITLSWQTEGDTFGSLGSPMCIWEYRLSGGSWESVPTEYLTPIGGGCELAFTAEQLAGLLGEQSKMELRCRVYMTHSAGGSMNILVGGIAFDAAGLTVSGDLLD